MSTLLVAVILASLLGSLHCVGMCGPFALWASGVDRGDSQTKVWSRLGCYHLGRLLTFSVAGVIAGSTGWALSHAGLAMGVQTAAARLAGAAMILLGGIRLWQWVRVRYGVRFSFRRPPSSRGNLPSVSGGIISGWLVRLRPWVSQLPDPLRAGAIGLLTTLLPCGWLYLFVLVAATTSHIGSAWLLMVAFWLGTLPALTGLVTGMMKLAAGVRPLMPLIGGLLLVVVGTYMATARGAADLTTLTDVARQIAAEETVSKRETYLRATGTLERLAAEPLPCCQAEFPKKQEAVELDRDR